MENFLAQQKQTLASGNIFSHLNKNFSDEENVSDIESELDESEVYISESDESESEFEYESDDDEKIKTTIKNKKTAEEQLLQLQKLSSVFQHRLNWLNKVPVDEPINKNLPDTEFPTLSLHSKNQTVQLKKSGGGFLLPQNAAIKVVIGDKTYIEFAPVPCKLFAEGKCTKGNECDYDHKCYSNQKQICKFILAGRPCKFTNCKFSHQLETAPQKVKRAMCRNGEKCENKKCTFNHINKLDDVNNQKGGGLVTKKENNGKTEVKQKQVIENKKFMLCRNMFKIIDGSIKEIGVCRFGVTCCFAHSWVEVKNVVESLPEFKCKFEHKCRGVIGEKIQKPDKTGVMRSVLRYKNVPTSNFKCYKIHKGERVTDYIKRTQSKIEPVSN